MRCRLFLELLIYNLMRIQLPLNLDLNSGNPIGVGITAANALNGKRKTAATAYLRDKPANLLILTETLVTGVIIRNGRAVGVKTLGKSCEH